MHFLLIILKMFFDLLSMTVALQSSGIFFVFFIKQLETFAERSE